MIELKATLERSHSLLQDHTAESMTNDDELLAAQQEWDAVASVAMATKDVCQSTSTNQGLPYIFSVAYLFIQHNRFIFTHNVVVNQFSFKVCFLFLCNWNL